MNSRRPSHTSKHALTPRPRSRGTRAAGWSGIAGLRKLYESNIILFCQPRRGDRLSAVAAVLRGTGQNHHDDRLRKIWRRKRTDRKSPENFTHPQVPLRIACGPEQIDTRNDPGRIEAQLERDTVRPRAHVWLFAKRAKDCLLDESRIVSIERAVLRSGGRGIDRKRDGVGADAPRVEASAGQQDPQSLCRREKTFDRGRFAAERHMPVYDDFYPGRRVERIKRVLQRLRWNVELHGCA